MGTHNDKAETYIKSGWMIEDYVKKLGKTPARDPPAMPATGSEAITTLRFETDKSDEQYEMDQAEKKIAEDQNAIHAAIANKEKWDAIEKYIEDKEEAQRIEDEKVENQRIEDEAEAQRIEDDGQREIEENQQMDIDQEEEPEMPEKEEELVAEEEEHEEVVEEEQPEEVVEEDEQSEENIVEIPQIESQSMEPEAEMMNEEEEEENVENDVVAAVEEEQEVEK